MFVFFYFLDKVNFKSIEIISANFSPTQEKKVDFSKDCLYSQVSNITKVLGHTMSSRCITENSLLYINITDW